MNEDRLKELLGEAPVPDADRAERRGLAMVRAAFAERQKDARRRTLPRLVVSFAAVTLLAALLLSPAGAEVRDWIGDAFTTGVRDAEPALTEVPGGGRLLVESPAGPWVVQPDGSRRLLGDYAGATWSPRGLFVAATAGHALSAIEPGGTVRWSLSAPSPVADPRWSPSGIRIAYRSGTTLRVVRGDGSRDELLDRGVALQPPVWSPLGPHVLAYLEADGGLRAVNTDTGEVLATARAQAGIEALGWSADGSQMLEATRRSLWLRDVASDKLANALGIGPARRVELVPGATVHSASFSPQGGPIAVLLGLSARGSRPERSEVVLIDPEGAPPRPLFTAPGRLSDLTWSPDGSRLLIGWPDADQWLFIPVAGSGRARAIGGISAEFAPGERTGATAFPRVEGWCCAATLGDPASP